MKMRIKLLLALFTILCAFTSDAQDTLNVSGKTYIGRIIEVDSAASLIYFSEWSTEKKLVISFPSVQKKASSNSMDQFINMDEIDWSGYTPLKKNIFFESSKYEYGPLSIGIDLFSFIVPNQYEFANNPTVGINASYLIDEKIGIETEFRLGMDLPQRESFTGYSEAVDDKALVNSYSAHIVYYPLGQTKVAPYIGAFFRFGKGKYYLRENTDYFLPDEFGERTVYDYSEQTYLLRSDNFDDRGGIIGLRFNLTSALNFDLSLPIYSTNSDSNFYRYVSYSNFMSENVYLEYRDDYTYREIGAQFRAVLLYRFGGKAKY